MTARYEARQISHARAEYLMGVLGLKGGILLSDARPMVVVQPVGSDISSGRIVPDYELGRQLDILERMGGCDEAVDSARLAMGLPCK